MVHLQTVLGKVCFSPDEEASSGQCPAALVFYVSQLCTPITQVLQDSNSAQSNIRLTGLNRSTPGERCDPVRVSTEETSDLSPRVYVSPFLTTYSAPQLLAMGDDLS